MSQLWIQLYHVDLNFTWLPNTSQLSSFFSCTAAYKMSERVRLEFILFLSETFLTCQNANCLTVEVVSVWLSSPLTEPPLTVMNQLKAINTTVKPTSMVVLSPTLWISVVVVVVGSILALTFWFIIYKRQTRRSSTSGKDNKLLMVCVT